MTTTLELIGLVAQEAALDELTWGELKAFLAEYDGVPAVAGAIATAVAAEDVTWEDLQFVLNSLESAPALTPDVITLTGAANTVVPDHVESFLRIEHPSLTTYTLPSDATLDLPVGTQISVIQASVGQVSILPGTGVTIRSIDTKRKTSATFARVEAVKIGPNEWHLSGDLV